jgi:hypothetical protein
MPWFGQAGLLCDWVHVWDLGLEFFNIFLGTNILLEERHNFKTTHWLIIHCNVSNEHIKLLNYYSGPA